MHLKSVCFVVLLFSFVSSSASAVTTLKQMQVARGDQVDMLFDQNVDSSQVSVEYFRDIIQLSIKGVSVYPAKIFTIEGDSLTKAFAYQYTPDLIRCRFTVKGDAQGFEKRIKLSQSGRTMSFRILPETAPADQIKITAAKPLAVSVESESIKKVREKVMGPARKDKAAPMLTAGKSDGSPLRVFGWLAAMLGLIGIIFVVLKRTHDHGFKKKLFGWFGKRGFSKNPNSIQVISTHYLGPKKSLAIVKIQGRALVLGVTDENINLITELEEESDAGWVGKVATEPEPTVASVKTPANFADLLERQDAPAVTPPSIREKIRRKAEEIRSP